MDHQKSKRFPEKHWLLLYWPRKSLWLCGLQQTVKNYESDRKPDHLICLLRNLYEGQEATVRTGHGTTDWFQIGKGVHQACILSPCLFNFYAEYIMRNVGWMNHKLELRLQGEISTTSDMQRISFNSRKWRRIRVFWRRWKRRVKKLT